MLDTWTEEMEVPDFGMPAPPPEHDDVDMMEVSSAVDRVPLLFLTIASRLLLADFN